MSAVCARLEDTLNSELREYTSNELRMIREENEFTSLKILYARHTLQGRVRRLEENPGPNAEDLVALREYVKYLLETKTMRDHEMDIPFSRVAARLNKLEIPRYSCIGLSAPPKVESASRPN